MATFPETLSLGTSSQVRYRVLEARFGDGYRQVTADGVNPKRRTITAQFNRRSNAAADNIIAFLDARSGNEVFDLELDEGTIQVRCSSWSVTIDRNTQKSISATFEEEP